MHSRKQYLEELRKDYEQAGPLKRGRLLDEAQKRRASRSSCGVGSVSRSGAQNARALDGSGPFRKALLLRGGKGGKTETQKNLPRVSGYFFK